MKTRNFWADMPNGLFEKHDYKHCIGLIVNCCSGTSLFRVAHPNCYIGIDITDSDFTFFKDIHYDDLCVPVHGGFTFSNTMEHDFRNCKNYWFFGWDYAHSGDCFMEYGEDRLTNELSDGKVWQIDEIRKELDSACKFFDELLIAVKVYKQGKTTKDRICQYCIGKKLYDNKFTSEDLSNLWVCMQTKKNEKSLLKCSFELERLLLDG